jgi:hypothetical protein
MYTLVFFSLISIDKRQRCNSGQRNWWVHWVVGLEFFNPPMASQVPKRGYPRKHWYAVIKPIVLIAGIYTISSPSTVIEYISWLGYKCVCWISNDYYLSNTASGDCPSTHWECYGILLWLRASLNYFSQYIQQVIYHSAMSICLMQWYICNHSERFQSIYNVWK